MFGLVLDTAGCGPTCKAGEASCSTNNGSSGDAGANSDPTPTTCAELTALKSCMDAYCKTADNPFCTCWKRGYDLNLNACPTCSTFDSAEYCAEAARVGADPASFDCAASSDSVKSLCVGVQ